MQSYSKHPTPKRIDIAIWRRMNATIINTLTRSDAMIRQFWYNENKVISQTETGDEILWNQQQDYWMLLISFCC